MTPEEWAEESIRNWLAGAPKQVQQKDCIAAAIRAAVAEEREACLKSIRDDMAGAPKRDPLLPGLLRAAKIISARGNT